MHTGPVKESDGTLYPSESTNRRCPKCHSGHCDVQTWESNCGGFEDEKITCVNCGHVWWIEGIDS